MKPLHTLGSLSLLLGLFALDASLGCAGTGEGDRESDDEDEDEEEDGEEEEEQGSCVFLSAPATDVGDADSPEEITLPFCNEVFLSDDGDEDCFVFAAPTGTLVQLVFDDVEEPISVDVYYGQFLSTGFTNTGHTVSANGDDITVCVTPDDDALVTAHLEILAPVTDNDVATDNGGGSFTFSFDAPGDEDCAEIDVPGLSHVIVTGDGCRDDDELDISFLGPDEFDFGFFAAATGQSCGLALIGASEDGAICISDHGATRTLGVLTFEVSFLDDDHGSGVVGVTPVTLPFSGAAETEIDGDRDCFSFTVPAATDIAFQVSGQASDDDVDVTLFSDGGEAFGETSGTATDVEGEAFFCVQGFVSGITLEVFLTVAP